ncbi:type III secretion system stator protein SctL [Xanthomonas vesicatoria]|uniref:Type 3 secretion system stator protein n=2 Tax=Xanthomonas vesicatoria TaxID=56460 RepID=F0BG75_9XANT|nr:type III secretion system stator protein SctL [Xanthomonas vesicatoria]APP75189.1 ATP-dependent helicase HrpB [Xanthomonas vesicatoria ATCC 35937]EGD08528.1 type III secretion protein/ HrpB5 protein [Xanthomonas vesicatoria ATCC 35937]KTF33970.1 ATP-dependent helicase HrpB [Xanthomonas vesicatoria]MCC8557296.1 type III secretion system stator protein SctL [Xanthomonas vesicatoria]MCC8596313.1 type III secretion system stator protein SctL [Xanthomonas vesicatoria]
MRLWLRSTPDAVGLDCDVIPREALAEVLALDAATAQVHARCAQTLAEAEAHAQTLIDDAQQQAEAILNDAQDKAERSARLGYAAGLRRQLDEWNERGLRHVFATEDAAQRARARLAEIVARACEQVLHGHDPAALYARAAQALDGALDEASALRVSVHPDALDDARRAFDAAAAAAGWRLQVELCGDADLALGACVCEWDTGVFEADLRAQLRSIQRVIRRVLATQQAVPDAC